MHILSAHNRSEFLATPQLIRFEFASGADSFEPTLLIKGSTLLLKYVLMGAPMRIAFRLFEGRLIYALEVCDDGNHGGILWSIVEREEELNGIRGLASGAMLTVFLFNELALNVAWNEIEPRPPNQDLQTWAATAATGKIDHSQARSAISPLLEQLHGSADGSDWIIYEVEGRGDWNPIHNHLMTFNHSASLVDIFNDNEGDQQEQLGLWLTDNLHPFGVHLSPQIPKGSGTRELTDILLSYEFGTVLIESKSLSIFTRDGLPDRAKLKRDVASHIKKAFRQLRGSIRMLKSGASVTTKDGKPLVVDSEKPAHAVVLIPDLDLIDDHAVYGLDFIQSFLKGSGGFPHLLDVAELLRVVQAAEAIAARSTTTSPMMAFDNYLMQRLQKAVEAGTLCIEVLLRFENEPTG